jgi:hypothetical protein
MNTQLPEPEAQARPATKFAYACGARPLPGYTIKRGIGRGGFGEVYYAVSDAGKEVAIKLIRRNLDVELRGVTQCLNLKHPHLLALHDVRYDDEENCWVVMEYVAGDSLEDVLDRSREGMPGQEALDWFRGIAAGVAYLHDRGLVHRDLKPGNIFNDEGVVKLGDYGLSKFISCSRRSGQTESVGTVHYMAPEIANGRYGREIDIYALGVILHEMLTGRVPFEGESVGEVLMKHLTAEPDLAAICEPYRDVVRRALAKDPAVRFATVEAMLAALPASASPPAFQSLSSAGRAASFQSSADTLPHPSQTVASEEPIWRWLRNSYRQLVTRWREVKLATPIKVLIAVAAVVAIMRTANRILPVLVWATVLYLIYRGVRAVWLRAYRPSARARPPEPLRKPANATAPPRSRLRERGWLRRSTQAYVQKPPRARLAELLASLLIAAMVSLVISVVMVLLRGQPPLAEQYAWTALIGTLGAWGILIPAKFWEVDPGEPGMRRFVMLVVGLMLGAAAYAVDVGLWVDLPFDMPIRPVNDQHIPKSFYNAADGSPLLYAYLVYFGFLFLLIRWWRSADPLRPSRVSLWSTMSALFVAWLLNFVWPFPQPWGFMVAATISLAVQLASPWAPPRQPAFQTANTI